MKCCRMVIMPEMLSAVEAMLPIGVRVDGSVNWQGPGICLMLEGDNLPRARFVTMVIRKTRRGTSAQLRRVPG